MQSKNDNFKEHFAYRFDWEEHSWEEHLDILDSHYNVRDAKAKIKSIVKDRLQFSFRDYQIDFKVRRDNKNIRFNSETIIKPGDKFCLIKGKNKLKQIFRGLRFLSSR